MTGLDFELVNHPHLLCPVAAQFENMSGDILAY